MTRTLAILALLATPYPALAQKTYKCLDARGVTQYTQTPSSVCKDKPLEIKGPPPRATGGPTASGGTVDKPAAKPSTATPQAFRKYDEVDSEGAQRAKTRDPKRPH